MMHVVRKIKFKTAEVVRKVDSGKTSQNRNITNFHDFCPFSLYLK